MTMAMNGDGTRTYDDDEVGGGNCSQKELRLRLRDKYTVQRLVAEY